MLEANRRPHQPGASREGGSARGAHRPEAEIGLAEARLRPLPALERADHGRRQRPGELRLPDEVRIAELPLDPKVAATPRAELAEAALNPALLAADRDRAQVAADFERVGAEQHQVGGMGGRGP